MNAPYALAPEPRAPHCGPEGLWNRADLLRLFLPLTFGAIGLIYAWYQSSGEAEWRDNTRWIVIAVVSVAVAGAGVLMWLIAGSARLSASRRVVRAGLARRFTGRVRPVVLADATEERVTAPRMRRYHRPLCQLMDGKTPLAVDLDSTELSACEVCEA